MEIKKEKVKCNICNEEYTLQMLKEHILKNITMN